MKQTNKKAEINSGDLLSESLVISFTLVLLLPGLVAQSERATVNLSKILPSPGILIIPFNLYHILCLLFSQIGEDIAKFLKCGENMSSYFCVICNILPVWTRTRILVKNVEFAGKSTLTGIFTREDYETNLDN